MDNIVETIEYKGYKIEVYQDTDSDFHDPRQWDNLGKMVCFHRSYNLGDKHNFNGTEEIQEYLKDNKTINLPLYLYDHSGITMNTTGFSCQWDSGQVGIIFVDYEDIKKEYNWKNITKKRYNKIVEYLKGEVKTYDQYLTGEIYGYCTKDRDNDIIDSCTGYYGYEEGIKQCISEGKNSIDYEIKRRIKKHIEKVKTWIKNSVPLQYRTPLNEGI